MTIVDLDASGAPVWQQASALVSGFGYICYPAPMAVRGDGVVYITEPTNAGLQSVTVADPNGSVSGFEFPPSEVTTNGNTIAVQCCVGPPMVNSDGTVYLEYEVRNTNNNVITSDTLYLYSSITNAIVLSSTTQNEALLPGPIIPDGQGGILATWTISAQPVLQFPYQAADVTSGVVGTPYNLPFSPQSVTPFQSPTLVLGQTGAVFARGSTTVTIGGAQTAVDQIASVNISSGAPNWTYQAGSGSTLSIIAAGSDGGVSISDSQQGIVHLDANGNAAPVTVNLGGTLHYSWAGQWFLQTFQGSSAINLPIDVDPANFWPSPGGDPSGNGTAGELCGCLAQTPDTSGSAAPTGDTEFSSVQTDPTSQPQPTVPPGCDICTLAPPPATSCLTYTGTGTLSVILVGDPGLDVHNAGNLFNLAAQQKANDLRAQGGTVTACRVATIQDVINLLSNSGMITGVVHYFGHSGIYVVYTSGLVTTRTERIFVGELSGVNTNISVGNVASLSVVQPVLGTNASMLINGCDAGLTEFDTDYNNQQIAIAQLIANNLNRGVYAYPVGAYFSHLDAVHDPYYDGQDPTHPGKSRKVSEVLPMYLITEGTPGDKPSFLPFCPGGVCPQH